MKAWIAYSIPDVDDHHLLPEDTVGWGMALLISKEGGGGAYREEG